MVTLLLLSEHLGISWCFVLLYSRLSVVSSLQLNSGTFSLAHPLIPNSSLSITGLHCTHCVQGKISSFTDCILDMLFCNFCQKKVTFSGRDIKNCSGSLADIFFLNFFFFFFWKTGHVQKRVCNFRIPEGFLALPLSLFLLFLPLFLSLLPFLLILIWVLEVSVEEGL